MNDRLKYKVFDKRDNKLKEIKGYTFSLMGMEDLVAIQWTDGFYECSIPLKNLIFCQCTGLKDCNGKLIYEGDIVRLDDELNCIAQFHKEYDIEYGRLYFILIGGHPKRPTIYIPTVARESEIIGNIYTTPELLEVKNETHK